MTTTHRPAAGGSNVWVVPAHQGKAADAPREPAHRARRSYDRTSIARRFADVRPANTGVTAKDAVARFLREMASAARRTFPEWRERLVPEIEECCKDYDTRRALLEVHPLDDYYLAGVVALEASKIRSLFSSAESAELLSQIGDQLAAVAGRADRLIPDLMFAMIVRIALNVRPDQFKRDYDQVCKYILEHMGVGKFEATRHLMRDTCYRHNLGEPLARGVPPWWKRFAAKYELTISRDGLEKAAAPVGS